MNFSFADMILVLLMEFDTNVKFLLYPNTPSPGCDILKESHKVPKSEKLS